MPVECGEHRRRSFGVGLGEQVEGGDQGSSYVYLCVSHAQLRAGSVAEGYIGVEDISVGNPANMHVEDSIRQVICESKLGLEPRLEVGPRQEIPQSAQVVEWILGE